MTEEQIVSGELSVTKDGRAVGLPVLKIKHAREWRAAVGEALNVEEPTESDLNAAPDKILDLVVAYDRTNALGGRESIEDSMTDEEVYDAFLVMWRKTFPFRSMARDLLT